MWKSDKTDLFNVLFILFDVVINSKAIFDIMMSYLWSTQKPFLTLWWFANFSMFFLVFDVVIFVVVTFSHEWNLILTQKGRLKIRFKFLDYFWPPNLNTYFMSSPLPVVNLQFHLDSSTFHIVILGIH
jgi:hypothetical protein